MEEKKRIHRLQCEQPYLDDIKSGLKTFELRYNDRAYQRGGILHLRKANSPEDWLPDVVAEITYVLSGRPWLADNYVALGIKVLKEHD